MIRVLTLFCLFASAPLLLSQTEAETAAAALKILDAYHAGGPVPSDRKLHIICWRPTDRDFAEGYKERVPRIMKHIQKFYADEMERNGFGRRTIEFATDDAGEIIIHEATGKDKFADYTKPEGQRVKDECWPVLKAAGLNPDKETVLIFTNLSDWDPVNHTFKHKSPYYASGNNQRGTAWQLDSPELDTTNLPLKEPMIQDGEYGRISLGKHNSIFIGGIAHELGHGLGLPHCRERSDEREAHGTALMGSGNRTYFDELRGEGKGTFLTLVHALRLASHPQFSGSMKGLHLPVRAEFSEMKVDAQKDSFSIAGKVTSVVPVYAVVAYLDPEGGSDYDAKTHATVPDADGKFSIECTALWPKKRGEVRLFALMANGATSRWASAYKFEKDGTLDVSAMQVSLELKPFVEALAANDYQKATGIKDSLANGSKAKKVASSILNGRRSDRKTVAAGEVAENLKSFPLSQITPQEAAVGWQKPAYDHLPRPEALLISGGEIFETGIYAHADARHVYDLSGGNWIRLAGKCGLPNQRGGSVVFVIKADGKEVFRSKKTEPGQLNEFDIDLNGVKTLELITENAGDGYAVDWGLWLGVELQR